MPEPDTATALYVGITQTALLALAIIGAVCWLLIDPHQPVFEEVRVGQHA